MEPYEIAEEKIHGHKHMIETSQASLKDRNKKVEEFDICLMAAVCPVCGKNLYLDKREIKKFRVRFTQYKHGIIRCPSGCKFVHPKTGNVNSPKSVKYMDCINYDIYEAHHGLVTYSLCENDA